MVRPLLAEVSILLDKGLTLEVDRGLAENVLERLGTVCTVFGSGTARPTGGEMRNRIPGVKSGSIVDR